MIISVSYLVDEQNGVATGVRIAEPPPNSHQALRGNLYAVVDAPGCPDPAALTDRVLSAMQRTYYTVKGSQSHVTLETARQVEQIFAGEVARSMLAPPWGAVVLSILPDRLAIAGIGSAFVLITGDDGTVHVIPPDRLSGGGGEEDQEPALWPLHRQKVVGPTTILVGSGRWLAAVPVRTLAATAAYVDLANCHEAAQGLRETAGRTDLPGLIIVAIPDVGTPGEGGPNDPPPGTSTPDAPSGAHAGSSVPRTGTGTAPAVGAASRSLPTALNATPPVVRAPPPEAVVEPDEGDEPLPATALPALPDQDSAAGIPSARSTAPQQEIPESGVTQPVTEPVTPREPPDKTAATGLGVTLASATAGVRAGAVRAKALLGTMLPDSPPPEGAGSTGGPGSGPDSGPDSGPSYPDWTEASVPSPKPAGPSFNPPPRATGSRARILIAAAVVLLLIVPVVVAARLWGTPQPSVEEATSLLDLAEARLLSAQDAIDQEDLVTGRKLLTQAQEFAHQGEVILGRTARSSELLDAIDVGLKSVLGVIPLYGISTSLTTFQSAADPRSILVSGQDIYVLDRGQDQVVRFRLSSDGESLENQEGSVVLRAGDQVAGAVVGPLVDLAWQVPIPGYEDKANLLVLDDSNQVFRYNQIDGPTQLDLGEDSGWQHATQLETYLDRLYALDEGANEIYRYPPGQYDQPPSNWFDGGTEVNIVDARSLRIDGDIWILFEDGKVVRYRDGEQVPYSLDDSVALPANPVDLWVGQDTDSTLYVVDAAEQSVLLFDKDSGGYRGQFRAAEGTPLQDLRALFIDNVRDRIFLLTGDGLYQQQNPL